MIFKPMHLTLIILFNINHFFENLCGYYSSLTLTFLLDTISIQLDISTLLMITFISNNSV